MTLTPLFSLLLLPYSNERLILLPFPISNINNIFSGQCLVLDKSTHKMFIRSLTAPLYYEQIGAQSRNKMRFL